MTTNTTNPPQSFAELFQVFLRIGLLSFGGPAAQIAVMHKELVDDRPWLSETQFLNALSFCMLLPGPEAMQLATYCGWRLRGVFGGIIAGLLFVMPGALVMLLLGAFYVWLGDVPVVEALFLGIKAAVVVIVLNALLKLSRKALGQFDRWVIAALSFVAIFAFSVPFPVIIAVAGLYGFLSATKTEAATPKVGSTNTLKTIVIWVGLWAAPLVALWLADQEFLLQIGLFFSKLAVVTFGGAYAVLAYMTQEVVQTQGWLSAAQMVDGLGLAETTPGPLILVTEFVGFLAGFGVAGWFMGVLAALLTLWVTFIPCFLWIFVGAPYIEWISTRPRLANALSAITAAVVGVILNLSIWFALHVFFSSTETITFGPLKIITPIFSSVDVVAVSLAGFAAVALFKFNLGMITVLAISACLGLTSTFLL